MTERMDQDLHPRTALVTGSTSGIGKATALALAREGFAVIVHGRDAQRGAATVEEITAAGGTPASSPPTCPTPPTSNDSPPKPARSTCW